MRYSSEAELRSLLRTRLAPLIDSLPQPPRDPSGIESPETTIQGAIVAVTRKLNDQGWFAYLVGGTLRDLLVGDEADHGLQPRDVDIIVEGATSDQLRDVLLESLSLERLTRFGGLHLSQSLSSGFRVQFDIWTLADTWGFRSQNIAPRIEDFPGTTFLNIDSCAFELMEPQGRERAFFEKGFFESIARRTLDLNYAPNPYPHVCAARALLLAAELDFHIAKPLAEFILNYSGMGGTKALIEAQQSHYGVVRSGANELEKWLHEIEAQVNSGCALIHIEVRDERRRSLRRSLRREIPMADNHGAYTSHS